VGAAGYVRFRNNHNPTICKGLIQRLLVRLLFYRLMMLRHIRPQVLLIGDSITQFSFSVAEMGFGAQLLDYYEGRRVDVVNRGFSGYNSRWIRQIIREIATEGVVQNTLFLTVFLGANDSVSAGTAMRSRPQLS